MLTGPVRPWRGRLRSKRRWAKRLCVSVGPSTKMIIGPGMVTQQGLSKTAGGARVAAAVPRLVRLVAIVSNHEELKEPIDYRR